LDKADEVRSKRKAALETLETVSQAIFIDMFGDPVANPMGWPIVKFTEVAKIDRKGIPPEKIGSGTQYVGLENIVTGGNLIDVSPVQAGELASQKFQFSDQHVLYGKLRPYLCKIATPEFSGICSTDILPILPCKLMNRFFLATYLRLPRMIELATTLSSGANLPRLSPSALENFQVLAPPLPEQAQFACLVAKVREEIRLTMFATVEDDHLFESLQQKAFQGAL
jgi:type I restriction enzyme S subunit